MKWQYQLILGLIVLLVLSAVASTQTQVVAWGRNDSGQCDVPALPSGRTYVEVAAGFPFSVGRVDDGSLVAWGGCTLGTCDVPDLPAGLTYVQVAAQYYLGAALRSDGSLVAWGQSAPVLSPDPAFVKVATGYFHVLAIRDDGSIEAWGDNFHGQLDVPPLPPGVTAVDVAGGIGHSVAALSDGSVIAWGLDDQGQCEVPALPAGLTYVEVAANTYHSAARRSDGSVVEWGQVFGSVQGLPPGVTYDELSAGAEFVLGRRSDGWINAWGLNNNGELDVPALPPGFDYVQVAAGSNHALALRQQSFSCGFAESYCESTPNSTGQAASISVEGSLSLADDDARLWCLDAPPNHKGLFFYGTASTQLPFGSGYLCISPFSPGLVRLPPLADIDATGRAQRQLDFNALPPAGQILPGSTWHFQFWFRDATVGTGTNLSDALRLTFCP